MINNPSVTNSIEWVRQIQSRETRGDIMLMIMEVMNQQVTEAADVLERIMGWIERDGDWNHASSRLIGTLEDNFSEAFAVRRALALVRDRKLEAWRRILHSEKHLHFRRCFEEPCSPCHTPQHD
jgi:hypothetical protein